MSKTNGRYKSKWTAQGYRYANRTSAEERKAEAERAIVQQLRPLVEAAQDERRKCFYAVMDADTLGPVRMPLGNIDALLAAMIVLLDRAEEDAAASLDQAHSETPIPMTL